MYPHRRKTRASNLESMLVKRLDHLYQVTFHYIVITELLNTMHRVWFILNKISHHLMCLTSGNVICFSCHTSNTVHRFIIQKFVESLEIYRLLLLKVFLYGDGLQPSRFWEIFSITGNRKVLAQNKISYFFCLINGYFASILHKLYTI